MTNTQAHAKAELEILAKTTPDSIVTEFTPEILALCEKFGNSGQSGGSAPYVIEAISDAVKKLLSFEPIGPLTGEASEWINVSETPGGLPLFQNIRESGVFKEGVDGPAYFIDAIVFDGNLGGRFNSQQGIEHGKSTISSRQYIKSFPFVPKTFYIDVFDYRWKDELETIADPEGDWWSHEIANEEQLKEVFEYYDKK
ncbi:MAG TPA: hypothetical protein PK289_01270 [Bacteroidia bacterium]|nr:hypothetical protein [Bacteroidia bacterium]